MVAAVAGVEPAVDDGVGGGLGLVPVALQDVVAAGQHLALVVDPEVDAEGRRAGPGQLRRPLGGREVVPLGAGAVHREQRRGLGEAVDLDELPAELGLDPLDGAGGRRGAGHDDARAAGARDRAVPRGGGVEHHGDHRRRAAQQGDAVLVDAPQDLGAVDLAQHDLGHAHGGERVGHAPAVAVEHRQRVQVDVAVADARCASRRWWR